MRMGGKTLDDVLFPLVEPRQTGMLQVKKKKNQNIFAPGFSKNSKFFIVQTSIKDHTFLIQNVRQLHPNKLEI